MTDPELKATVTQLSSEVLKLTQLMQKYTEGQIRQEEKDKRQDEINERVFKRLDHIDDGLQKLNDKIIEIELKRAEEKDSREGLRKHWPVLFVLCLAAAYQIPRILPVFPTK